jgi:branched-chain amino acid transport system substrate-binding protein
MPSWWRKTLLFGTAGVLLVAGCSSSKKSSSNVTTPATTGGTSVTTAAAGATTGNQASVPGVTSSTITLGLIYPATGSASSNYTGIAPSARARIAQQNAAGGVDGRQIKLVVLDDQSSPALNATASQELLSRGVFGVIDESPFVFGGYKVFQKAGVPVTGGGYDGFEWGLQPNTNMFSSSGSVDPHANQYTTLPNFMKAHGATTVAAVSYGVSPSSTASAKGFIFASQQSGLKNGYLNTSLPFGSINVAALALSLKSSGSDGLWLPLDANSNFAILTAARQAGANIKVPVSATGYGQALLDDVSAVQAMQGSYLLTTGAPVELHNTATTSFQAALAKYENFSGVPDFGWYEGWYGADLMIKGLQMAGPNPTRSSFIDQLHTVTNYDAGGLLPPADLTLAHFGQPVAKQCSWYVQLKGKSFVPVPSDGSVSCGTLVPNSAQL